MLYGYVPAGLKHTSNGEPCADVALYSFQSTWSVLAFMVLVARWKKLFSASIEDELAVQSCSVTSLACESFLLELSQDLKQHALVNYLV